MITTTINAQTNNFLSEELLAEIIKKNIFPTEYMVQIYNFFTDVPVQDINLFVIKHQISDKILKIYYEKYIKNVYSNTHLEELIYYAG